MKKNLKIPKSFLNCSLLLMFVTLNLTCYSHNGNDKPSFDGRIQRAEYISSFIKEGDVGAEIGVNEGSFAYYVLLKKNPSKLYLIDPWMDKIREEGKNDPTEQKRDVQYKRVCGYFAPFKNVEILRMKAEDAAVLFKNDYFDYVYIDGEHSYEAVTRDLTNYFYKVKVGGYLMGDDYGWKGIRPAVHDFINAHKEECIFVDPHLKHRFGQYVIKRIK